MADTPLTPADEPAPTPPPEPVAADVAAPHDVAPPEPEAAPTPDSVVEETPAGEAVSSTPVEPEEPPAREEGPDAEAAELEALEAEVGAEADAEPSRKRWYVVKVQSGREESIKEAIERRVKIERLEEFFGQIVIPVERVTEMRKGKRVVKERKLYPGYLMAEVELVGEEGRINDRILYLFRETSGVGDFVGGTPNRPPPPMSDREVAKMIGAKPGPDDKPKEGPVKPPVERGDRVRVRDGTFAGMEGEVKDVLEALNHLRVELTIFGRPVPVELEYWQVEPV